MASKYRICLAIILLAVVPLTVPAMNLNPTYHQQQSSNIPSKFLQVFDMELLKAVTTRSNSNVVVSPASIKQVLAMILEGAGGESAEQLIVAMNLPHQQADVREIFRTLLQQLARKSPGVTFEVANHIFISDQETPQEEYKENLLRFYRSGITPVNFETPYPTSNLINNWVNNVTHGLIPSLVTPESIKPQTSVILGNALYFKGLWEKSFNTDATRRACFYHESKPSNCYHTYMMDASDTYNYVELREANLKALELPYRDNQYAMLIILPNKKTDTTRMLRNLPYLYSDIVAHLAMTEVVATIPRFTIDYTDDIARILEEMEIKDIFSQVKANLSGIVNGKSGLYVSNVFHKAKIEVNEQGTVAAASTGAVVVPLMGNTKPVFRADHPFVFIIRHVPSGTILFEGRLTEPEYAQDIEPPKPPVHYNSNINQPEQARQYQTERPSEYYEQPEAITYLHHDDSNQQPIYQQVEPIRQQADRRQQQATVTYQQSEIRQQAERRQQQANAMYQQPEIRQQAERRQQDAIIYGDTIQSPQTSTRIQPQNIYQQTKPRIPQQDTRQYSQSDSRSQLVYSKQPVNSQDYAQQQQSSNQHNTDIKFEQ